MAACVLLIFVWGPAVGASTVYSDRTAFEADAVTFDIEDFTGFGGSGCNAFENIPDIDCGPGPSTLDFGDFTVEALAQPYAAGGAVLLDPDLHLYVTGSEVLQIGGQAAQSSNFQTTATWSFDAPLNAFAADTNLFSGTMDIKLINNATEVDSFGITNPVSNAPYFFGVISDLPFNQVIIEQEQDDTVEYDNITYQVAAVPLPAAFPLFLGGLAILAVGMVRRLT